MSRVKLVAGGLYIERVGQLDAVPAPQRQHWTAVRHRVLGQPILHLIQSAPDPVGMELIAPRVSFEVLTKARQRAYDRPHRYAAFDPGLKRRTPLDPHLPISTTLCPPRPHPPHMPPTPRPPPP